MLSLATIRERLGQAGVDISLADMIRQHMYYGGQAGEEAEDFLQEAIVTCLGGGDVKLMLGRLGHVKRRETNIESMLGDNDEHEADAYTILEKESTDNDRPDWIPNDMAARVAIYEACSNAMDRTYRKAKKHPSGAGFVATVRIMGNEQFIGYFPTNPKRGLAERAFLHRVMGWVSHGDDSTFTTVCVRCQGPKSKYGVRFCWPCAKDGAVSEFNRQQRKAA